MFPCFFYLCSFKKVFSVASFLFLSPAFYNLVHVVLSHKYLHVTSQFLNPHIALSAIDKYESNECYTCSQVLTHAPVGFCFTDYLL